MISETEIQSRLTDGINYAIAQGATVPQLAQIQQLLTDITADLAAGDAGVGVSGDQSRQEN